MSTSARKAFLRRAEEVVGPRPHGITVASRTSVNDGTGLPCVDVEYHVDDKAQQQWVFTAEERLGQEFEIWVRPL